MQRYLFHAILLIFGHCHAVPHAGLPLLNPGGIGGIFQGPGSSTIIRGPDGSEIISEQEGGAVVKEDAAFVTPIVVAEPEIPVVTQQHVPILSSTPVPIITNELHPPVASLFNPIVVADPTEIVHQDPHVIETVIVDVPDVEPELEADIEGPSGRIITKGSASIVSGPASTTITEPRRIVVAPPTIAVGTPSLAHLPDVVASTVFTPIASYPSSISPEGIYSSTPAPPIISSSAASIGAHSTSAPLLDGYSTPSSVGGYSSTVSHSYSSSLSPEVSYSTTAAPPLSYSTSPVSSTISYNTINLGGGYVRESIPVVEHSSSNGFVNSQGFVSSTPAPLVSNSISSVDAFSSTPQSIISSTESPILSNSIAPLPINLETGQYSVSTNYGQGAAYSTPQPTISSTPSPILSNNIAPLSSDQYNYDNRVSSTPSPTYSSSFNQGYQQYLPSPYSHNPFFQAPLVPSNIQRIPRFGENVIADGRLELDDNLYQKIGHNSYQLPHILSMALSRFYRKAPNKNYFDTNQLAIDDKLDDLSSNEIFDSSSQNFNWNSPNLAQSEYIGPALQRNGVDANRVNLAPIDLSQVSRFVGGSQWGRTPKRYFKK